MDDDYRLFGSIVMTFFAIAILLALIGELRPSWLLAQESNQTTLIVAAKSTAFDKPALTAKPGAVSIEFDNQDAGVTHNFHLVNGGDGSAASIGMTPITSGPDSETLRVTLAAGRYLYHCDVHPTQMIGELTVN